jgi:hypothetical protein
MKTHITFALVCLSACLLGSVLADSVIVESAKCPIANNVPCPFGFCYVIYDDDRNPVMSKKYVDQNSWYKVCVVDVITCLQLDKASYCNIDVFDGTDCRSWQYRITEWEVGCN